MSWKVTTPIALAVLGVSVATTVIMVRRLRRDTISAFLARDEVWGQALAETSSRLQHMILVATPETEPQ